MTLPKKKRNSIVVDNVEFHWTRGRSPEDMWITIQHASGTGALLRIDTYGIPLPKDVADAIRFAIRAGWIPDRAGSMFYRGFTDQPDHERFVVRTAGSPDYWREFTKDKR